MNSKLKLLSLSLLVSMISLSVSESKCMSSGVGAAVTASVNANNIKLGVDKLNNLKNNKRAEMLKKAFEAIKNSQSKFKTPVTTNTEKIDGPDAEVNMYSENDIQSNNDATKLPSKKSKQVTLKTKKYKTDNPTKYHITETGIPYDNNGMIKAEENGGSKRNIITRNMFIGSLGEGNNIVTLTDNNNITIHAPENSDSQETNNIQHFSTVKDANGTTLGYISPQSHEEISEMLFVENNDDAPTHLLIDDLASSDSSDKTTRALIGAILGNETTLKDYRENQLKATGDNAEDLYLYNNKYYINTVKHPDLGLSDDFITSVDKTINGDKSANQTFKDVSKWSFGIGGQVFYLYRIYDWYIIFGLGVDVPLANRTVSLYSSGTSSSSSDSSSSSKKSKNSSNDLSLTHSFDVYLQLLGGYNITQNFSFEIGVEGGYSKWKIKNMNQLSNIYSFANDKLADWLKAGDSTSLDDYNKQLKDSGISSDSVDQSLGKWFIRAVIGFRYNFSNFSIGIQGFWGPSIKLLGNSSSSSSKSKSSSSSKSSSLIDINTSNYGGRVLFSYVF